MKFNKLDFAFFGFGLCCLLLGIFSTLAYTEHKDQEKELDYILMVEKILAEQRYDYKQIWIEEHKKQPVIEYRDLGGYDE